VLGNSGRLVIINNFRDESVAWVKELSRLVNSLSVETERTIKVGALESAQFCWFQPLSASDLVDLMASRSYVLVMDEADRIRLLDEVERIAQGVANRCHTPDQY